MTKIGQKLIRILGAFSLDIPLRGLSGVLPQGSISSESHCDLSVTGVLHHSIFCIKIRSLPDLTISWSKNLIFLDKVLIAFEKTSVNFWGIILCLWLRINNPSKICMSQLYIVGTPRK